MLTAYLRRCRRSTPKEILQIFISTRNGNDLTKLVRFYSSNSETGKIDDDDDEAWIPPTNKHNHNIVDEDFKPGLYLKEDGTIEEYIDMEALMENPELLEKLKNDDGRADLSEHLLMTDVSFVDESELQNEEDEDVPDWSWAKRGKEKLVFDDMIVKPREASNKRYLDGSIPPIDKTLFKPEEVIRAIEALGGEDIKSINIRDFHSLTDTIIVATCNSPRNMHSIAEIICKSMRKRNLHKVGIVSAKFGYDGKGSDDWVVIDCGNIWVHIQDSFTRKHIDLENHWTKDNISELSSVRMSDDLAVDNYVMKNPVPEEYSARIVAESISSINLQRKSFELRKSKSTKSQRLKKYKQKNRRRR